MLLMFSIALIFSNSFYLHNVLYLQWKRGRHLIVSIGKVFVEEELKNGWHDITSLFFWMMRTNESFTITTGTCIKDRNCDSMLALINSTVFPAASYSNCFSAHTNTKTPGVPHHTTVAVYHLSWPAPNQVWDLNPTLHLTPKQRNSKEKSQCREKRQAISCAI